MKRFSVILHVLATCSYLTETADMVYTPPPKTKECIEREQTVIVLNLYEGFLNLSQNMFAITQKGAGNFKDLVTYNEEVRKPPVPVCKRKLPKFARCKFDEVVHILNNTTCRAIETTLIKNPNTTPYIPMQDPIKKEINIQKLNDGKMSDNEAKNDFNYNNKRGMRIKEDAEDAKVDKYESDNEYDNDKDVDELGNDDDDNDDDNDNSELDDDDGNDDNEFNEDEYNDEDAGKEDEKKHQRKLIHWRNKRSAEDDNYSETNKRSVRNKRAIKDGQVLIGKNGEITRVRKCYRAGSISRNNHLRMTRSCSATTTLPENRFPRFLNEVICDFRDGGCIHNEGVVIQRVVFIRFKIDVHRNLTAARLGAWQNYQQEIRASCECQIRKNSLLSGFVG